MTPPTDYIWIEGTRVLVLEDEFLIALELERIFEAAGALEILMAARVAEAAAMLARPDPVHLAVLDVHLGNQSSEEIALLLMARKVPFVYGTGMDSNVAIPERLRYIPVVPKPYNAQALFTALARARHDLTS